MSEDIGDKVRRQVQRCLESAIGGSGHLAAVYLDAESFQLKASRALGGGLTEYSFSAAAFYETELEICESDGAAPAGTPVAGSIVLDADLQLARDEQGRARIAPWRCLDPDDPAVSGT